MSDQATIDDASPITLAWKAQGIINTTFEAARTYTLRSQFGATEQNVDGLLDRLPRLFHSGEGHTLPELRIKGTLGEGGMGTVELAEQISLGRDVAVKKVRTESSSLESTMSLLREGWTTGLLEHPNIIPIYTLGRNDSEELMIVMKKVEGIAWLDLMRDPALVPDALKRETSLDVHIDVLIQICNALHYAHSKGVIHRDLKPENVMLGAFGEVYVLDWGIAVSMTPAPSGRLPFAGDVCAPSGTPVYMAPEMTTGEGQNLGIHTDIFLLGAMLYEVLSGHPPYQGNDLYEVLLQANRCVHPHFDNAMPADLVQICKKAMAKAPEERYQSARDFREALYAYKRRRESHRLSSIGFSRFHNLQSLITTSASNNSEHEGALQKAFGECRFAFEQALEVAPDNAQATDGLQKILETMADVELRRESLRSAALLISEFPYVNPVYQQRLEVLEHKLSRQHQELLSLKQLRHDLDPAVGRRARGIFALVFLGVFWTFINVALQRLLESGALALTHQNMMAVSASFATSLAMVFYLVNKRFRINQVTKKIALSVTVTIFCGTALRGLGWMLDLAIPSIFAIELMFYAASCILVSTVLEKRFAAAAPPLVMASLATALWPSLYASNITVVNIVVALVLFWVWRRR